MKTPTNINQREAHSFFLFLRVHTPCVALVKYSKPQRSLFEKWISFLSRASIANTYGVRMIEFCEDPARYQDDKNIPRDKYIYIYLIIYKVITRLIALYFRHVNVRLMLLSYGVLNFPSTRYELTSQFRHK